MKIVQSSNGPEGVIARDLGIAEMRAGNLRAGLRAVRVLINGRGFPDPRNGKSLFFYAHPIFWAPFSLIGEGGDFKVAAAPIGSSREVETEDRSRPDSSSGTDSFQVFGD